MIRQRQFRGFKARYHRNGVGGEGFFLCRFKFHSEGAWREMQAVVFDRPGACAVTSEELNERWRGDDFESALREAIKAIDSAKLYASV